MNKSLNKKGLDMERKHARIRKKEKRIKKIVILCILLILISVFGRYVYFQIREAYLTSKAFYFTSDLLTIDNAEYQYENWGGVDNYEINFDLYSYANTLLRLDYDLEYALSCETPDTDKITLRD